MHRLFLSKNDYERRWVNGTIGTIAGIDEDETLYVITEDGKEVDVKKTAGATYAIAITTKKKR